MRIFNLMSIIITGEPPIYANKGNIKTSGCTFSNCASSKNGGVLYLDLGSVYADDSSTFTQNAANSGGAIYSLGSTIALSKTIFTYNYAYDGGAVSGSSISVISQFTGVSCNYNYASDSGACLYLIELSKITADTSTFSNNQASKTASAVYFLGTDASSFTSWTFSNNYAMSGNTISLFFAPTTLISIIVTNNIAEASSTGLFIIFSVVTTVNFKCPDPEYPFSFKFKTFGCQTLTYFKTMIQRNCS